MYPHSTSNCTRSRRRSSCNRGQTPYGLGTINDVIVAEPVEVGESAEQISDRDDVLTLHLLLPLDRIDPLFGRPSPEGTLAFCHLTQERTAAHTCGVGLDAGIVERIVQRLHQPVERLSEIHRSTVTVITICLGITCHMSSSTGGEAAGAIVSVEINRPCPRAIVSLLRFCLLRSPLGTCAR